MIRKQQLYTTLKTLPVAMLLASGAVHAEDFSMDVTATIQVAATSTLVTTLGFGTISADPAGFTASIAAGTGAVYTAAVTADDNRGSDASAVLDSTKATITGETAGLITVSGITGIQADITFDAATTNLVCATNALSTMQLSGYDAVQYTSGTAIATAASGSDAANNYTLGCTIGGTGNCQIYVGGLLTIGAAQEACAYSGAVDMTVAYQ